MQLLAGLRHRRDDALMWSDGRSWVVRAPLVAWIAYSGVRHLLDPQYGSWFSAVTLGIHELGHVIFQAFGTWLGFAGGTICQLLAPIAIALGFVKQRDYFAISIAGAWLAHSMLDMATYMADARARELPLVGLTSDPLHDWEYLLSSMGLLSLDTTLAFLVRVAAFLVWALSLAASIWLCYRMARSKS